MRAAAVALILAAPEAAAGAWPRGEGQVFVSVSHVATAERETITASTFAGSGLRVGGYSSLFAEWGLTPRVTLGVDFGTGNGLDEWTGIAFLRRSFNVSGPNVWGVELGVGQRGLAGEETESVLRPALHWGRGTDWGWMGLESYIESRSVNEGLAWKLDATLGWRQSERASWIAQVQTADYPGADITVRLAPSYVRRLGERLSVELGVVADVAGAGDVGLELGTWLEF